MKNHPRIKSEFKGGGACEICEQPALLAYRDESVGMRLGKCCIDAMVLADALLGSAIKDGIRHPQPGEKA